MYKCEFWTDFVDEDKFRRNLRSYAYGNSFIFSESDAVKIKKVNRNGSDIFHISISCKRYPEIMGFMAGVGGAIRDAAISEAIEMPD